MIDWLRFKSSILNLNNSRQHKVTNSIGVYDLYKYIRKNKWFNIGQRLTEHQFYTIIRQVNNLLTDELVKGNDIKLPNKMGTLELRKYNPKLEFKDNKLINKLPIDWDRTIKLWYEDKESFNNKTLVRVNNREVFKVYYNKSKANYNNKNFYTFSVNRDIKRRLKDKIKLKEIDAYEMGRVTI